MWKSKSSVAESHVWVFRLVLFFCFLLLCSYVIPPLTTNFDIFQVPLTLSSVTGRRLDFTSILILVWNIDRCDWRDKKLFAATSTTWHVQRCRLPCVFKTVFPSIDIQQALYQVYSTRHMLRISYIGSDSRPTFSPISAEILNPMIISRRNVKNLLFWLRLASYFLSDFSWNIKSNDHFAKGRKTPDS